MLLAHIHQRIVGLLGDEVGGLWGLCPDPVSLLDQLGDVVVPAWSGPYLTAFLMEAMNVVRIRWVGESCERRVSVLRMRIGELPSWLRRGDVPGWIRRKLRE